MIGHVQVYKIVSKKAKYHYTKQSLMINIIILELKAFTNKKKYSHLFDFAEIDHYTATFTGCRCPYNTNLFDCACCQNGGCQCGEIQANQCTNCNNKALCGSNPGLFPPPTQ